MRFTPVGRRVHGEARLNITPMIDIVFLMLVFFIATTTFVDPESSLSPLIRTADSESARSFLEPQIVHVDVVDGQPTYRVGELVLHDQASLRYAIAPLPKQPGIFMHVTDRVSIDFAVAGVQAARDAGFEKVTYVPAE
ncbi:MAG: biopolymer transporter ExbD [Phycisphaerales bacterium]|nr:biopolymer transporter ExbD [Phycisphaerales bacterium]